jgi:hypothetical protein
VSRDDTGLAQIGDLYNVHTFIPLNLYHLSPHCNTLAKLLQKSCAGLVSSQDPAVSHEDTGLAQIGDLYNVHTFTPLNLHNLSPHYNTLAKVLQ